MSDAGVHVPRKPRRIGGDPLQSIVFLAMAAMFFWCPLYVTDCDVFKDMDQIREGAFSRCPIRWTVGRGDLPGSTPARVYLRRIAAGVLEFSLSILVPSLIASIAVSMITGYALAIWEHQVGRTVPFSSVFLTASCRFQISYPLIGLTS